MTSSTRKQGINTGTDNHKRHKLRRKKTPVQVMTTDTHNLSNLGHPCQQYNPSSGSDVHDEMPGGGMGGPELLRVSHVPEEAVVASVGCNIEVIGSSNNNNAPLPQYADNFHGLQVPVAGTYDKVCYVAPPSMNTFPGIQPPGVNCFVPSNTQIGSMHAPFSAMTGCISSTLNGYHPLQMYRPELADQLHVPHFSNTNYVQLKTSYPNECLNDRDIFLGAVGTNLPPVNHADISNANVQGSFRKERCTPMRLQKLTNTSSMSENVTHSLTNTNICQTDATVNKIRQHSSKSSEPKLRRGVPLNLNSLRGKQEAAFTSKSSKRYSGKISIIERGRIARMRPFIMY